ncbi:hypothetical protein [Cellulomonas alba]|uniref:Uncharacterized protein n=1 Tax=Cellulomonas alba TaxID=3053467 RepID=A0ABT7SBI6_9CELL|nr:hypothetical protein [Cellulomonas alba]MDM7853545.1 hypothetical protein [Cellulomonas alba]
MARAATVTARLVGPPGDVRGVVDVPPEARRSIVVAPGSRSGKDGSWPGARVLTAPAGVGATEVRLLLPDDTPPGPVDAEVLWDGGAIAATVEVLAEERVDVRPHDLRVVGAAGDEVPVQVHLTAHGNVAVDVPKVGVLAFERAETLQRAIVAALSADKGGLDRWAAAADAVADDQSGVARVVVTEGAGPLGPAEQRWLSAAVHVPTGLEPGSSHVATWLVAGTRVRVQVDVAAPPPGEETSVPPAPARSRRASTGSTGAATRSSSRSTSSRAPSRKPSSRPPSSEEPS